jgi:hypothetical protein
MFGASLSAGQYQEALAHGASPLPLFVLVAAILYGIWARQPQRINHTPRVQDRPQAW